MVSWFDIVTDDVVDDYDFPMWFESKDQFLILNHIDLTWINILDVKAESNRSFDDYDNAYGC